MHVPRGRPRGAIAASSAERDRRPRRAGADEQLERPRGASLALSSIRRRVERDLRPALALSRGHDQDDTGER